jgi:hypothetical protein
MATPGMTSSPARTTIITGARHGIGAQPAIALARQVWVAFWPTRAVIEHQARRPSWSPKKPRITSSASYKNCKPKVACQFPTKPWDGAL